MVKLLSYLLLPFFLLIPLIGMADDELLPVTDAFKLTAEVDKPGEIALDWDIADNYYMYRGRIHVKSLTAGVELGELELPDGKKSHDDYFGDVEIYHQAIDGHLPYTVTGDDVDELELEVEFQGCHEVAPEICYPPHTQTFKLDLPAAAVSADDARSADANADTTADASSSSVPPLGMPLGGAASDPLPPDQAFKLKVIPTDDGNLKLKWDMPDDYYMYRDRTKLDFDDADGVSIGDIKWPQGEMLEDEYFGKSEVYFDSVEVPVELERDSADAQTITLHATYQGCQNHGICYPPIQRDVDIKLAALDTLDTKAPRHSDQAESSAQMAGDKDTGAASQQGAQSEVEVLAGGLVGNGRWLALLGFLVAGLALAFTPCVLPMIPILSGLIAGAGKDLSTARAFVLSLVYVLASSLVFVLAGVVAGLVGASLQAAFQSPWLLSAFAILFVLLALSMFGFYELKPPAALANRVSRASNKQQGGSLVGVAIMGVLSALIVGPCVAPPLAGAVLYIAQSHDPFFGGLALFFLSIGMGIPLIIFGTAAGRILPRAGGWMIGVQRVFGVLFLALAIYMLSRFVSPLWVMLASGVLLIASAVYMGAFDGVKDASGWRKLWKGLGLVLFIFGAAQLVGVSTGSRNLLAPLSNLGGHGSASSDAASFTSIKTVEDLDKAMQAAQAEGKPVMLDFYADWCITCKQMEQFTYGDSKVNDKMQDFVLLQADVTQNDKDDQALLKHFDLFGPPAYIFYPAESAGKEAKSLRLVGFENAGKFKRRLDKVSSL